MKRLPSGRPLESFVYWHVLTVRASHRTDSVGAPSGNRMGLGYILILAMLCLSLMISYYLAVGVICCAVVFLLLQKGPQSSTSNWESATKYHLSTTSGGNLTSVILGADTPDRADKWKRIIEQVLRSKAVAPAPISAAGMFNETDIWWRRSLWSKDRLMDGRQIWKQESSSSDILRIQETVDAGPQDLLRIILADPNMTLIETLSPSSDVVAWDPSYVLFRDHLLCTNKSNFYCLHVLFFQGS